MVITFDPKKDKLNQRKHGISLSAASAFDWGGAVIWPDQSYLYSELRECGVGLIGQHLYFVSFVDRTYALRVLSLRRATKAGELLYVLQKT
jgi:uncharacterized DUF497 family protein